MGSPVSVTLSEVMLEELAQTALSKLSFQPLFYYRYVDDCIAAVPANKIEEMLSIWAHCVKPVKEMMYIYNLALDDYFYRQFMVVHYRFVRRNSLIERRCVTYTSAVPMSTEAVSRQNICKEPNVLYT